MGAYLFYQLKDRKKATEANDFLEELEENKELITLKDPSPVFFTESDTVEYYINELNTSPERARKMLGRGDIKTSGLGGDMDDLEHYLELQTKVFEALNEKYDMEYKSRSCAFTEEEYYFTIEQMKRITQNGNLLSCRDDKMYGVLKNLLKEEEEAA